MSGKAESIEDPFPDFDWDILSVCHPTRANDVSVDQPLTTADLVYLLGPGDEVLWTDRTQPLEVVGRDDSREVRYDTGHRTFAWTVEGNRGGQYTAGIWWNFPDGQDEPPEPPTRFADVDGVWPQSHRHSHGAWETDAHFHELAVAPEADIVRGSPNHASEVVIRLLHTIETDDRTYPAMVTGVEFGEFTVLPLAPDPVSEAEYTVSTDQVLAYRQGVPK